MKLPNFLIVGFPRCGTTTLWQYLDSHPDVYIPRKELWFFHDEEVWWKGIEWYMGQFNTELSHHGEATPFYFYGSAMRRIKTTIPDIKIVFILRDPVQRAYSHYWERVRPGRKPGSFEKAIQRDLEGEGIEPRGSAEIFRIGMYERWLEVWFREFKRDQIHIMVLEELMQNEVQVLMELCAFLGISYADIPLVHLNKGRYLHHFTNRLYQGNKITRAIVRGLNLWVDKAPPMKRTTKKFLDKKYGPHIDRLEELLGKDLSFWKQGSILKK
jgi:hypothetical protein